MKYTKILDLKTYDELSPYIVDEIMKFQGFRKLVKQRLIYFTPVIRKITADFKNKKPNMELPDIVKKCLKDSSYGE
jgi:hypothetical protein